MHEQSETVQGLDGRWYNVYGQNTPQAGQPLPNRYPYERHWYPNVDAAEAAAERRSRDEGRQQYDPMGPFPGQSLVPNLPRPSAALAGFVPGDDVTQALVQRLDGGSMPMPISPGGPGPTRPQVPTGGSDPLSNLILNQPILGPAQSPILARIYQMGNQLGKRDPMGMLSRMMMVLSPPQGRQFPPSSFMGRTNPNQP